MTPKSFIDEHHLLNHEKVAFTLTHCLCIVHSPVTFLKNVETWAYNNNNNKLCAAAVVV